MHLQGCHLMRAPMTGYSSSLSVWLFISINNCMLFLYSKASLDIGSVVLLGGLRNETVENVTCLESLGEVTSSKSDTFLTILMCYKGRLGVVPYLSLQAKNSDMTVLRIPDDTFNCNSGGESARMSVGVLDFSKVIYHCAGWNHLKVRGTGSNKALMLEDFEYPSPNLPFRDTLGQGNTKLNVTKQMVNYNQVDLNSILAFKVLEQHILIVTERQDLSEADMYFVDYPVHAIQLVYKYKRVVDHHPVDVAMQKGPVFYLLTTQSIIRVPLGGSSTVITQDINSGRHMIALSRADLFVTQRFNQEGTSSGKLLHIDSNSGNARPICHSRSHKGGAAGQCGITSPTLLSIISQSRALVLDESARFILINYRVKSNDSIFNAFVGYFGLDAILISVAVLVILVASCIYCYRRIYWHYDAKQNKDPHDTQNAVHPTTLSGKLFETADIEVVSTGRVGSKSLKLNKTKNNINGYTTAKKASVTPSVDKQTAENAQIHGSKRLSRTGQETETLIAANAPGAAVNSSVEGDHLNKAAASQRASIISKDNKYKKIHSTLAGNRQPMVTSVDAAFMEPVNKTELGSARAEKLGRPTLENTQDLKDTGGVTKNQTAAKSGSAIVPILKSPTMTVQSKDQHGRVSVSKDGFLTQSQFDQTEMERTDDFEFNSGLAGFQKVKSNADRYAMMPKGQAQLVSTQQTGNDMLAPQILSNHSPDRAQLNEGIVVTAAQQGFYEPDSIAGQTSKHPDVITQATYEKTEPVGSQGVASIIPNFFSRFFAKPQVEAEIIDDGDPGQVTATQRQVEIKLESSPAEVAEPKKDETSGAVGKKKSGVNKSKSTTKGDKQAGPKKTPSTKIVNTDQKKAKKAQSVIKPLKEEDTSAWGIWKKNLFALKAAKTISQKVKQKAAAKKTESEAVTKQKSTVRTKSIAETQPSTSQPMKTTENTPIVKIKPEKGARKSSKPTK